MSIRYSKKFKVKKKDGVEWVTAPDIKRMIIALAKDLDLHWVVKSDIFCCRSKNTKTRALARIWGLPRIWQLALKRQPAYIIEVISEKFDKLPPREQNKVLLHEIAHIPKNFSGALIPHFRRGKRKFRDLVGRLEKAYNIHHQA